jgi:ribosomal protein S18 acetylase RimI-like enzyme
MSQTETITTSVRPLDPALDAEAAVILAACPALGTPERAAELIADARRDDDASLYGLIVAGRLAGAYVLRKIPFANEIAFLAVAPEYRRQGYGKMCLHDALLRSGRRPLAVDADDASLSFFKACGFKLVGKRRGPDGAPRYRLGWHAPLPKQVGSGTSEPC